MFVEVTADNGKRMLLNLMTTFCVTEGPNGEAIAVSIAGVNCAVPDTKYETIAEDLLAATGMDEETDPPGKAPK